VLKRIWQIATTSSLTKRAWFYLIMACLFLGLILAYSLTPTLSGFKSSEEGVINYQIPVSDELQIPKK
jgi:hypothetical protein